MPEPSPVGRWGRLQRAWNEDIDPWLKIVGGVAAAVALFWGVSGWLDQTSAWFIKRALAGEIRHLNEKNDFLEKQVGTLSNRMDATNRLGLQKQEIELSKEIAALEREETRGRLSPGEASYLHIIRQQRDDVRRELRKIGRTP